MSSFYKSFLAVLAGVFSAILTGLIIKVVFEKVLNYGSFPGLSSNEDQNDLGILLNLGGWFLISSLIGGLVCVTISGRNDISHIVISSLVVLALYFFIDGVAIFKDKNLSSWIVLLTIPIGYFIGEWMGARNRKASA